MNVRRYRPGEETELWRLCRDAIRFVNARDYTPAQIQRWAPDEATPDWPERLARSNPFVADQDGQLVGFVELEPDGHIDYFYCHYQWQRRGIGRALYRTVENEAVRAGIRRLFTEVSVTARPFFESMGFEVTAETNHMICGAPARQFRMQKRLGQDGLAPGER